MASDAAADPLAPVFQAAGQEWNVDPQLLRAIALQETGGARDPDRAVSGAGAIGRMQLMPDAARGLGVTDPTDPVQSIYAGAKYLSQGLDAEGAPEQALLYYHGGPNWRAKYGPESAAYVPGVTAHYVALGQPNGAGQPAAAAPAPGAQPANGGPAPGAQPPAAPALPSGGPARAASVGATGKPGLPPGAAAAPAKGADAFTAALSEPAAAKGAPVDAFTAALGAPEQASASSTGTGAAPLVGPASFPLVGASAFDPAGPKLDATIAAASADGPVNRLIDAAGRGAASAFGGGPLGLDAAGTNMLQRLGVLPAPGGGGTLLQDVNQAVIPGVAAAGDLAYRAGGALLRGAQGLVTQGGAELARTPVGNYLDTASLARDVAALPEAFPTGELPPRPMPNPLLAAGGAAERSLAAQAATDNLLQAGGHTPVAAQDAALATPGDVGAAPAAPAGPAAGKITAAQVQQRDGVGFNEASRRADAENAAAAAAAPAAAAPATGAPGPQAAGAQANPGGAAGMTPAEVLANRATAERQKLMEAQPVGTPDLNKYVPGVNPSTAATEQTVNAAREAKTLGTKEPEVSAMDRQLAADNNDARTQFLGKIVGSPVDIANQVATREAVAQQDLQAAFGNKKPSDAQGVADTITNIMKDPRDSQNSAVKKYVAPLLARVEKLGADDSPGGTIMADPEQLYGLREDINRMQDAISQAKTPDIAHVTGQLQQVAKQLDSAIEAGAPGYRDYLANFHAASIPIDEMQVLQKHEPQLYDAQGRMQFSRVQNMMRQIVTSRQTVGLNPYKSISDDTMGQLFNLRDDLRRSASADELAKAKGSDTAQNVVDMLKHAAMSEGGTAAAGIVGSIAGGPIGAVTGAIGKRVLGNLLSERARQRDLKRGAEIFQPDANRLRDPNAP